MAKRLTLIERFRRLRALAALSDVVLPFAAFGSAADAAASEMAAFNEAAAAGPQPAKPTVPYDPIDPGDVYGATCPVLTGVGMDVEMTGIVAVTPFDHLKAALGSVPATPSGFMLSGFDAVTDDDLASFEAAKAIRAEIAAERAKALAKAARAKAARPAKVEAVPGKRQIDFDD